jgi:hypothetical protein
MSRRLATLVACGALVTGFAGLYFLVETIKDQYSDTTFNAIIWVAGFVIFGAAIAIEEFLYRPPPAE